MPDAQSLLESWEVLDLLASLVQKSLVVYEEDEQGVGRYRLLETVRQYARARLLDTGEAEGVRERHRDCFLALAEEAGAEVESSPAEQVAWLEWLEQEHDNLRAALAWSIARGQAEAGLRLGRLLAWLWQMRGYFGEGREYLAGLLALPGPEASTGWAARAKALRDAGILAWHQGDDEEAGALLENSLTIYRELGDKVGISELLWWQGHLAKRQEDHRAARALFEESLAISRERGHKGRIGASLQALGEVAYLQGNNGTARVLFEESLAISRELAIKNDIAWSLYHLGGVALSERDYGTARAHLVESLAIFQELGQKRGIAHDLERTAVVAAAQAQSELAARLFGAAERLRAAMGAPLSPAERVEHDRSVAALRTALAEAAYAAAWTEGRAMPLEEITASALVEGEALGQDGA
jgi:tetratricopeptide (TPR) repeat protein